MEYKNAFIQVEAKRKTEILGGWERKIILGNFILHNVGSNGCKKKQEKKKIIIT